MIRMKITIKNYNFHLPLILIKKKRLIQIKKIAIKIIKKKRAKK
jgi:hypothetical protein